MASMGGPGFERPHCLCKNRYIRGTFFPGPAAGACNRDQYSCLSVQMILYGGYLLRGPRLLLPPALLLVVLLRQPLLLLVVELQRDLLLLVGRRQQGRRQQHVAPAAPAAHM